MGDEFKVIGEAIKLKRKEMQLSLKDIENSTSIRSSYLEAIEEGKVDNILSSVYVLGFIRQYATFLGMNLEELAKSHPEVFKFAGMKHDFAYGIGTLEVRGNATGGVKWFPNLIWAGASAVVIFFAWYLAKHWGIL